ncbi:MAG: type II toxin-antitoxin system VapC family toxin [Legionella sp.]|nr:type II toxin-antitoxin system VapC family toxin [Legionella sp.]
MTNHSRYLLDTHAWLWFVAGDTTLSPSMRTLMNTAIQEGELYLSSISFWEVGMLVAKKRIVLNCPSLVWIKQASAKLQLINLTAEIAVDSCELPDDFHGDPADRMIVASARVKNLVLLTRDNHILKYSKKHHVQAVKV